MKIIIVGGGIGGLALAAGLKKQGFGVTVIEKDTDLSATGGYHITLHKDVQDALHELLPSENITRILASAADGKKRDADVFWDWRGRRFWSMKPLKDPGIDIDRISLRVLLAEAAGDTLILGRQFVSYEIVDNEIIAKLDDGNLITGDLLVGCDGTKSTIVKQLLGHSTNTPTGVVGISGRTPVSKLSPELRLMLGTRSSMAMGPDGIALYFGYFDPVNHSVIDRPELRASITKEATYIWGAMFPESDETRKLKGKKNVALQSETVNIMKRNNWSPKLLNVISNSNIEDIAIYRFNAASSNSEDLAPWSSMHIIALGDAVHATPPTAGMGAGIAIRDAEDLVSELMKVRKGEKSLNTALREVEYRMRVRGSKAIVAALAIIKMIKFTDTRIGRVLTKILLPIMAAFSKIFGKP